MLILILINVQYLQKIVFSFEKGSNGQNHSSSGSHYPIKKSPHLGGGGEGGNLPHHPLTCPLTLFGNPCLVGG